MADGTEWSRAASGFAAAAADMGRGQRTLASALADQAEDNVRRSLAAWRAAVAAEGPAELLAVGRDYWRDQLAANAGHARALGQAMTGRGGVD